MPADPLPPTDRPTKVRWLIFILACASSWLLYLHRYSWGLIKGDFRKENPGFTDTEIGWLDSAFSATYAIGQVPSGMACDRWGPRGILASITLLWSGAMVGVAWTSGFWRLFNVRAFFGLAQAGAYPILSKVTRNWFPLGVRTSVQGVVAALGRIGAACSSLVLATLLMGWLGFTWQTALAIMAIPGIILAAALWLVLRNNPQEHPWTNEAERSLVAEGQSPPGPRQQALLQLGPANLFNLGMLLLYAFASTFQDQLYVTWIPLFLEEERGLDKKTMGLFAPLPLIGGAIGGIVGGILNDVLIRRTGNRRWVRSGIGFLGKFVAAGLVLWSVQVGDGRLAMVVLMAARFFGDWSLPTQWGAITDLGGRASATVFGLVNMVGALGGFVANPILGNLKQHFGFEGLFAGVAIMCLLAALTWFFIDCTRRLVAD